jgi:hypothetical protein
MSYIVYKDNIPVSKKYKFEIQAVIHCFEKGYVNDSIYGFFLMDGVVIKKEDT